MGDLRDVPGQRETRQFRGKLFIHLPPPLLRRLLRDVARRERSRWIAGKVFFELRVNLARIDIADDDEREIVRHVARPVVLQHVLQCELVEDLNLADHRDAIGMPLIGGFEHELPHHPIGIVVEHGELSPDDFLFLAVLLWREGGVHHRVGQNIERARDPFPRHVNPKDGSIEGSIGVDVAALVLHALRDRIGRARPGALEEHVLENMREAGAEMAAFVDAARAAPSLHACDRRAPIGLHDYR